MRSYREQLTVQDTGSHGYRALRRAVLQVDPRDLVHQGTRAMKDSTEETVQSNQRSRGREGSGQENEEITESYYLVGRY